MDSLAEVNCSDVYCTSKNIADKFGKTHTKIVKKIEDLIADIDSIKVVKSSHLKFIKTEREYRGQIWKGYLLNRQAYSLLCMRFTGKKALEWQIKFNDAFYEMEKRLLLSEQNSHNAAWVKQREQRSLCFS